MSRYQTSRILLILKLIAIFCLINNLCYAQATTIQVFSLDTAKLNNVFFNTDLLKKKDTLEKVYIHFDKSIYTAGDTIYFKAYVTMGEKHYPSNISGVLRVLFFSSTGQIIQSIKLQLINGITWGDLTLPSSLPGGKYRILAYTKYMLNENGSNTFNSLINIVNPLDHNITDEKHSEKSENSASIKFFPEGGPLVADLTSKVSFKSTDEKLERLGVSGIIVDSENKLVTSFKSIHDGMGYFYIKPEFNKFYKANLMFSNGIIKTVNLPHHENNGLTMLVNNDSLAIATITINSNKTYFNNYKNKPYKILIKSGDKNIAIGLKLDTNHLSIDLLKRRLHTGINIITLISNEGEILCNRLIFIQNYDQLDVSVEGNDPLVNPNGEIEFKLNVKNRLGEPATGHFSASIVNENKAPDYTESMQTIIANVLLTSDLQEKVNNPNYYFAKESKNASEYLDLLMLTNCYSSFQWKQLLKKNDAGIKYIPENFLSIKGLAKTSKEKPYINKHISLISVADGTILQKQTDRNGAFEFNNLLFTDSTKFILNSNDKQYDVHFIIDQDSLPIILQSFDNLSHRPITKDSLLGSIKSNLDLPFKTNNKIINLKEVKVIAFKSKPAFRSSVLGGAGSADQVIGADVIEKLTGSLPDILNGRLKRVRFYNGVPYSTRGGILAYFIDGVPIGGIEDINPRDVAAVELLDGPGAAIYGFSANGAGVIAITTKSGSDQRSDNILSKGMTQISIAGFNSARKFHTPEVFNMVKSDSAFYNKKTIYWNPELITDKNGELVIKYNSKNNKGDYRLTVEGIDENGNLGRIEYNYTIK